MEGTNLYFNDARAKTATVADTIVDGTTDKAPSQNSVFDALASKQNVISTGATTDYFRGDLSRADLATDVRLITLSDTITDSEINKAPTQNAVFDALSGKLNKSGDTLTGDLNFSTNKATFKDSNTNTISLKAPDNISASFNLILPSTMGTAGQVLKVNGTGNLYWDDATTLSSVGSSSIIDGSITDDDISSISQAKIVGLTTALSGKEATITSGTTSQYYRGDKTWQSLDTTSVIEGTNLYFNDARAKAATLADTIVDGTTDKAPSQNAVFDALASKQNVISTGATTDYFRGDLSRADLATDVRLITLSDTITDSEINKAPTQNAVFDALSGKLSKAGDTLTGDLNFATNQAKFSDNDGASNNISIKAPSAIASDFSLILPNSTGTNGQALTTDGAGNLSWTSIIPSVTSTNNAIARYDGTTGIVKNSSVIIDDNGKLGIGAPSIAAQLHVKGSGTTSATTSFLVQNSAGSDLMKVTDDKKVETFSNLYIGSGSTDPSLIFPGGSKIWEQTGVNRMILQPTTGEKFEILNNGGNKFIAKFTSLTNDNNFQLFGFDSYNGTPDFRLTSSGNVSIGKIAPAARLHIKGSGSTSATNSLLLENSNGTELFKITDNGVLSNPNSLGLGKLSLATNDQYINNGTGGVAYFNSTTSVNGDYLIFGWSAEDSWSFAAGDGSKWININIQPFGGNVGIGKTNPTATAHIKSSGSTSATTAFKVDNLSNTALFTIKDDGAVTHGPLTPTYLIKSTDYTLLTTDPSILYCSTGSIVTITLPASPSDGQIYSFRNTGANTCTLNRNGNNINGGTTDYSLPSGSKVKLQFVAGSGWFDIL